MLPVPVVWIRAATTWMPQKLPLTLPALAFKEMPPSTAISDAPEPSAMLRAAVRLIAPVPDVAMSDMALPRLIAAVGLVDEMERLLFAASATELPTLTASPDESVRWLG